MKHTPDRPLVIAEKELEYEKHLRRIDEILKQSKRREVRSVRDIGRAKNKSAHVYLKHHQDQIELENEKLLSRLLDISQRKSLSFSNKLEYTPTTISINPYRKKLLKKIHDQNEQLAERLISKQSEFSVSKVAKEIQEYERIKRSMIRNKRVMLPTLRRDLDGSI